MANVSHIEIDGTTYDITPASPVSVGNGQLTIQKNGVDVQTFTANQSSNSVANITLDKSDVGLSNVPNVSTDNQTPTFTEAASRVNINSGETLSVILGKIEKFFTDLKTVAFSGSYNDLSDKPAIPTNNNQLTNGAGYITSSGSCNYANSAGSAGSASVAAQLGNSGNVGAPMTFNWSGLGGQPYWLWGGDDGQNMYVYNPANFSVSYANSAGSAGYVDWGCIGNKPGWGLFQDQVASTDITFPVTWTQAEILLRDTATGKAAVFTVHKALLTSGNTILTSGYYYTSADYCSFLIFINQQKIYGKSVTINGVVRSNPETTITILTSAAEV